MRVRKLMRTVYTLRLLSLFILLQIFSALCITNFVIVFVACAIAAAAVAVAAITDNMFALKERLSFFTTAARFQANEQLITLIKFSGLN